MVGIISVDPNPWKSPTPAQNAVLALCRPRKPTPSLFAACARTKQRKFTRAMNAAHKCAASVPLVIRTNGFAALVAQTGEFKSG